MDSPFGLMSQDRSLRSLGPDPGAVLRCQHKYYLRLAQREAVPEAVPDFLLLDGAENAQPRAGLRFPLFVKTVKYFFSIFAQEVGDTAELREITRQASRHLREFIKLFDQLLRAHPELPLGGGHLLAETPLRGWQVTVEGCTGDYSDVLRGAAAAGAGRGGCRLRVRARPLRSGQFPLRRCPWRRPVSQQPRSAPAVSRPAC